MSGCGGHGLARWFGCSPSFPGGSSGCGSLVPEHHGAPGL